MRRITIGVGIAVVLGLVIIMVSHLSQRRPGAVQPAQSKATGLATQSKVSSSSKVAEFFGRESEADRRKRMITSKTNRQDFALSPDEVGQFVQASRSNAVSLVAAFEASRDKTYLKLAAEKYPNDPFVLSKVLMHDVFPEDRAKWVEAFKKNAPDNAFANMLAARDAMKSGNIDAAKAEVAAMRDKSYDEYMRQSMQGSQEAYLSAGRPLSEALTLGMAEITLPHLAQVKETSRQFIELADKAASDGDAKTQQEMLAYAYALGQKMRDGSNRSPLITDLVGLAMQNASLSKWPVDVPFGDKSATDIIEANKIYRRDIQKAAPVFDAWFPNASDAEIMGYSDRVKMFGEREASSWLREIHPEFAQLQPQN